MHIDPVRKIGNDLVMAAATADQAARTVSALGLGPSQFGPLASDLDVADLGEVSLSHMNDLAVQAFLDALRRVQQIQHGLGTGITAAVDAVSVVDEDGRRQMTQCGE
jgi:hypothetical protein